MNTNELASVTQLINDCTTLEDLAHIEKWLNRQKVILSQWERNKLILGAAKKAGIDPSKL